MRKLSPRIQLIATVLAVLFAAFFFYTSGFGVFSAETHRGFFLLGIYVLCLIYYPASKKRPNSKVLIAFDVIMIVLSIAAIMYWVLQYTTYASKRVGMPNKTDIIFGLIMIICSLEVTRRVLGNVLVILGIVFTLQLYFGPYLGSIFAHKALSWQRIIEFDYMTMEGMFGTIVTTFATYIMPFLVFGAFLEVSGGGEFFIDLAKALTGHVPGGPALIAVFGSAVFGSISGSPIANVVATGSFTIPMMKKTGYKGEFAGAVEAAASTGGQFLPPIMGAGAFILASLTQTSYGTICLMAIVPALLYYLSVGLMVFFRAKGSDMVGLSKEELPKVRDVLKRGWYYIFVLVVAVVVIIIGYAAESVAFYGSLFIVLVSAFKKETRFTPKKFVKVFESAGKNALMVGSCAGTLGLVMAGITLAGLGVKFSKMLLVLSNGNLLLNIFLILIIALIIGMGLPTTASYILMAILCAPSLVLLDVPTVQAHLLVFWLAMTSNVTPPVCVTAFAAASLAEASPMKTGFQACKLACLLYIMPFTFAYRPALMLIGGMGEIIISVLLYIAACFALAGAMQGWLLRRVSMPLRVVLGIAAVAIMLPGTWFDIAGIVAFAVILAYLVKTRKNDTPQPTPAPAA